MTRALCLGALLSFCACAHSMIPGTHIPDTEQTRAILSVMEQYRAAMEAKDVPKIVSLLAPTFSDNEGTSDPTDDLTYADAPKVLAARLSQVEGLRLNIDVRGVHVENDHATADYYYTEYFTLPKLSSRAHTESDIKQMQLVRVNGKWKISAGI